MPDLYLIGDSTVTDNTPPFRGWGWALTDYTAPGVRVFNHAQSGRSSRSFRDEGLFAPVEEALSPGDLLLIQFGHNDEKDDAARHTDPDSSFPELLGAYCDAAERKGALPVLVTPVCRRYFIPGGELLYTHGEYPLAIRTLAKRRGLPLCDLKRLSRKLFLSLGEEKTAELFVRLSPGEHPDFPNGHSDMTHFNADGAKILAGLVAQALKEDARCRPFFR